MGDRINLENRVFDIINPWDQRYWPNIAGGALAIFRARSRVCSRRLSLHEEAGGTARGPQAFKPMPHTLS